MLTVQSPRLVELAVGEALAASRADRLRRWVPGVRCHALDLGFQTAEGWVKVQLHCGSGFFLDFISPTAWQ